MSKPQMSRVRHNGRRKDDRFLYAAMRHSGLRLLALLAPESPPMSLIRDTDLAQRTVALFGGAREGESPFFGVLTAEPEQEA
jgi:hypothetical protein